MRGLFFVYFRSFPRNSLHQINVKDIHAVSCTSDCTHFFLQLFKIVQFYYWYLRSQPLEHQSSPITTRSGYRHPSVLEFWSYRDVGECVTRLGDLLHFGQLFKACSNDYFAQITHIFSQFF